jgi:hypothetical protein
VQRIGTEPTGWRVPSAVTATVVTVAIAVGAHPRDRSRCAQPRRLIFSPGWMPLVMAYHVSTLVIRIALAVARVLGGFVCVAAVVELAINSVTNSRAYEMSFDTRPRDPYIRATHVLVVVVVECLRLGPSRVGRVCRESLANY